MVANRGEEFLSQEPWGQLEVLTDVWHEKPIRHALLKVPDHRALGAGDRDRHRLAVNEKRAEQRKALAVGHDQPIRHSGLENLQNLPRSAGTGATA